MPKKIDFPLSCKNDERTNSISLFVSLDLNVIKRKKYSNALATCSFEGSCYFWCYNYPADSKEPPSPWNQSNAGPTIYISCQSNMQKRYLLPKVASRSIVRMRKNFLVLLLCLSFVRCESRRVTDYGDYLVQDYGK